MSMETIVVALVVLGAALFIVRRIHRRLRRTPSENDTCCSDCQARHCPAGRMPSQGTTRTKEKMPCAGE
ncbi:MAG: hypothetical protein DRI34_05265 [Deltaproteobacteria bacterium]|nr:MAG: hypothetical protein DRI34_05265 [Deltaproteobacteria bacterium]